MSYSVKHTSNCNVDTYQDYLVDSNIWIALLSPKSEKKVDKKEIDAIDFFNKITTSSSNIVVTSSILSEVINRMIRINFKKWKIKHKKNMANHDIKKTYQRHPEYNDDLTILHDDILSFQSNLNFVSDSFEEIDPIQMLKKCNDKMEFNDYLYIQIAKKNNYTILTIDGDFLEEGVNVVTSNRTLAQNAQNKNIADILAAKQSKN